MTEGYSKERFRYRLEADGVEVGRFSEALGNNGNVEPVQYREGNIPASRRGLYWHDNLTLKWVMIVDRDFYDWIVKENVEVIERKSLTIHLLDATQKVVASWKFIDALPIKYTAPEFNATSNDNIIESIEIAYESMTRID